MTYEDVKRIRENPTAEDVDKAELAAMIDKAVEKQIARKPRDGIYVGFCECGKIVFADQNYCPDCGQKCDWSKRKEYEKQ